MSRFSADLIALVRPGCVVDSRHNCRFHVLQTLEAVKRRIGLKRYDLDVRIELLKPAAGSHEGAARSQPGNEVSNSSRGLLPNLDGRGVIVRLPVCRVVVLICVEVEIRILGEEPPGL